MSDPCSVYRAYQNTGSSSPYLPPLTPPGNSSKTHTESRLFFGNSQYPLFEPVLLHNVARRCHNKNGAIGPVSVVFDTRVPLYGSNVCAVNLCRSDLSDSVPLEAITVGCFIASLRYSDFGARYTLARRRGSPSLSSCSST